MPALYNLASSNLLPEKFAVVKVAIDAMDKDRFREQLTRGVQETTRGKIVLELWNTAFQRTDFVEAGWQAITPILDVWGNLPARKFPNYITGTWGRQKPTNSCTATAVTGITCNPTCLRSGSFNAAKTINAASSYTHVSHLWLACLLLDACDKA